MTVVTTFVRKFPSDTDLPGCAVLNLKIPPGNPKQNISSVFPLLSMVLAYYSLFLGMASSSLEIQMQNFHHYLDNLSSSSLVSMHPNLPVCRAIIKRYRFSFQNPPNCSPQILHYLFFSNPFCFPTSKAILSKKVNLVIITHLQLSNSPSLLL